MTLTVSTKQFVLCVNFATQVIYFQRTEIIDAHGIDITFSVFLTSQITLAEHIILFASYNHLNIVAAAAFENSRQARTQ
jgi:hypothetical protein